ncbi:hypothetical protein V6238_16805 [Marinomonas arenicola]|uniref:hypothetical protein n=1 Tax=Marinomonas arenicola TaxID=569601 RepID=UPI00311E3065
MWNFSFLRVKAWPQPSRTLLCLLVVLQIAAWYPLWQYHQSDVQHDNKQQARMDGHTQLRQRQAKLLASNSFTSETLQTRVVNTEKGEVTQWAISGKMLLGHWQAVQEKIQEKVAIGLVSASWTLTMDGHWQGHLLFDVLRPNKSQPQQDWLPARQVAMSGALAQWRLISVAVFQGEASALLSYQSAKCWVAQGDWLPTLGLSVQRVLPDQVTFVAPSGDAFLLSVRDRNGMKE